MSDIFISYKREDRDKAKVLAEFLVGKGFDVWWDINLLAGQEFAEEIDSIIRKAKAVIVLWTPLAIESSWVKSEATLANSRKILVPVFLEETELKLPFNILHTHDITTWSGQPDDPILETLIDDVERLTGESKNKTTHDTENDVDQVLLDPESEFKFWVSVTNRQPQSTTEYQLYLDKFGDEGWFAELAKTRIADLTIRVEDSENNTSPTATASNNTTKGSGKNKTLWFLLCLFSFVLVIGLWNWELIYERTTGRVTHLPEMVYIPAGSFKMGSPVTEMDGDESERPVQDVSLDPFYIGKYEVTFAEYEEFANATNRPIPADEGWGQGNRPAINVNWYDAQAYAGWLSSKTGRRYRLPSEAEWEYVARAGSKTHYWWGGVVGVNRANCDSCGSEWDGASTAPVGKFAANAFGVYDTAGNVWEWVEDCWHDDYTDAPGDGTAWLESNGGGCGQRVFRGGSWFNFPGRVRSAYRYRGNPDDSSLYLGFRLAQDP